MKFIFILKLPKHIHEYGLIYSLNGISDHLTMTFDLVAEYQKGSSFALRVSTYKMITKSVHTKNIMR